MAAKDIATALTAVATCTVSLVCDDSWCDHCFGCEVEPGRAAFLFATHMHTHTTDCLSLSPSFVSVVVVFAPRACVLEAKGAYGQMGTNDAASKESQLGKRRVAATTDMHNDCAQRCVLCAFE